MKKKMAKKKIRYRTFVDRDFGTVYLMDKKTGRMKGRKSVKGFGDRTAILRVSSPKKYQGQIMGRTKPIKIRGSKKQRAYVRRTL